MLHAPPYVVKRSESLVEAWAIARLQFEPAGWQRELRAELRDAVAALHAGTGLLHARYHSPVRERCDTENILFYNVGTGAFTGSSTHGVHFERGFEVPAPGTQLASVPLHYHRYELGLDEGWTVWEERATLAAFSSVELPHLSADSKPASVWLALHEATVDVFDQGVWPGPFGLRLRLELPGALRSLVALLKPLIDGVTAAFGTYQGSQLGLVSERLGRQLARESATVAGLLSRQERAVLGACQLVVPRAAGVQWQPADERCLACELVVERTGAGAIELAGQVVAVEARANSAFARLGRVRS